MLFLSARFYLILFLKFGNSFFWIFLSGSILFPSAVLPPLQPSHLGPFPQPTSPFRQPSRSRPSSYSLTVVWAPRQRLAPMFFLPARHLFPSSTRRCRRPPCKLPHPVPIKVQPPRHILRLVHLFRNPKSLPRNRRRFVGILPRHRRLPKAFNDGLLRRRCISGHASATVGFAPSRSSWCHLLVPRASPTRRHHFLLQFRLPPPPSISSPVSFPVFPCVSRRALGSSPLNPSLLFGSPPLWCPTLDIVLLCR